METDHARGSLQGLQSMGYGENMTICDDIFSCEDSIRHKDYEIAFIFADYYTLLRGRITQKYPKNVFFTEEEFELMQNNILTHNHTGAYTNSFSREDVLKAAEAELKEIRVVGGRYTYSMVPGRQGWPACDRIEEKYEELMYSFDFEYDFRIRFAEIAEAEQISALDYHRVYNHFIWARLAEEMDLKYSRKTWPQL
jgi:hypothetical protein